MFDGINFSRRATSLRSAPRLAATVFELPATIRTASSFDALQGTQKTADTLATQAATGDLKDVHDYMIASTEAALATEMVVTIKNKAVEAFNEIMRMPV